MTEQCTSQKDAPTLWDRVRFALHPASKHPLQNREKCASETVSEMGGEVSTASAGQLPHDVLDAAYEFMVKNNLPTAVCLSTTSKTMRSRFSSLLQCKQELKKEVDEVRDASVREGLELAKGRMGRCEPSFFVVLWFLALTFGVMGTRAPGEWLSLEIYPCLVLAYSVSVFARKWHPNAAKLVLLIFDFSLSYAGNIFCTLQIGGEVTDSRTHLALFVALASTIHALGLSIWMMSVSVQPTPWKDLQGWFHPFQSRVMMIFYISLAVYYEGLPGVWKLSSACCRLFTLVHLSWMWILPKAVDDDENGNENGVENNDDAQDPGQG